METITLTGKQKRYLRGLGHGLKPAMHLGKHGMDGDVIKQLEQCLLARELVKVRVLPAFPLDAGETAAEVARQTGAALAQKLGHTLLFYRPHPDAPAIHLPAAG